MIYIYIYIYIYICVCVCVCLCVCVCVFVCVCVCVCVCSNPYVSNYFPTKLKYHLFPLVHFYLRHCTLIFSLINFKCYLIVYGFLFFFFVCLNQLSMSGSEKPGKFNKFPIVIILTIFRTAWGPILQLSLTILCSSNL